VARIGRYFARYSSVIPDFSGFLEAVESAAPVHLRVNTLKARPEPVRAALRAQGFQIFPERWCPLVFRVNGELPVALGTTLLHALGHVYLQSASSVVPALALGARPGDRVLDLCAAPGSKTTFVAQEMRDEGCLVANEPNRSRVKSLVANLERLGVTSAIVTAYSGQNFPLRCRFDRVLVDAPCSGEGTWRGRQARPKPVNPGFRAYLARQQAALLRRGYEVLNPGGVLVYATCTYAPEENEAVMVPFLAETGARVIPLDLDVQAEPGLTEWAHHTFPAELALARRLYPHRFDSEGFFVVGVAKP
jgi:NOL1/NOP2/sun family putative RNA methylase